MSGLAVFGFDAFVDAFDTERRSRGLGWYEFAAELWDQSIELNARRPDDHCPCGGALSRLRARGAASCQYALFMLRVNDVNAPGWWTLADAEGNEVDLAIWD
jgi:hypothetical protein